MMDWIKEEERKEEVSGWKSEKFEQAGWPAPFLDELLSLRAVPKEELEAGRLSLKVPRPGESCFE